MPASEFACELPAVTADFKGTKAPRALLYAVFFCVSYRVSCRDLEAVMAGHGVDVDHATLNRWGVKLTPPNAAKARVG